MHCARAPPRILVSEGVFLFRRNSLRAVFAPPAASCLFWQQYFDSPDGIKYCHYYLRDNPVFPHIGVIDPVTGELVQSWTGFKDAERLMDRLMDYADEPPTDPFAEMADTKETLPPYVGPEGTSTHDFPLQQMDADQSAATVSTPLESASAFLEANDSATSAAGDVEIPWPSPPELPQMHAHGSVVLRIRLPSGEFAVYISSVRSAVAIGFATDFKCCSLVPHVKLYSASLNRRREFHEGILVRALPRRCLQLHTPLLRGQAFHAAKV